jgi:hypothetical protein
MLLRMSVDMARPVIQCEGKKVQETLETLGAKFSNYPSPCSLSPQKAMQTTPQSHIDNTVVSPSFQLCPLGSRPKSLD